VNKSNLLLSEIVAYRTYAKHLSHVNRRETLEETLNRNLGMFLDRYPKLSRDILKAGKQLHDFNVMPSMRSLQFGGEAIVRNNVRLFNCSFANITYPRIFAEALYLLLSGTGFGYSVQKHHVNQLPNVKKPKEEGTYVVHDSIEGWAEALRSLTDSYFYGGIRPLFDFSKVRAKGSYLVTTGAKAPGPEPLRQMLIKVEEILKQSVGRKLRTIEVHDMICLIADCVLSGGIRRAALISLFDRNDTDMLTSKHGSWWEKHPHRARANNSAVLPRESVTYEEFKNVFDMCIASNAGEPGFFFTNDIDWGTNPCAEIGLRSNQFCVAGDTTILTRKGIVPIKNMVGVETEVWNGEEWSKVKPFKTGENTKLYRVKLSDGSYLDATAYHKFLAKRDFEKEFSEVTTLELKELVETYGRSVQVPRANVNGETIQGYQESNAYEYGFFLGDGHIDKGMLKANLYREDKNLGLKGRLFEKEYFNWNNTSYKTIELDTLSKTIGVNLKSEEGIPDYFFELDYKSTLDFFAGWIDADGSQANKGCRLYGKQSKLRDAQKMLTRVGIISSLNLMEEEGIETNLGIRRNAVWYLQIPNASKIPSRRLNLKDGEDAKYKGKFQIVKEIKELDGLHDTFCLTEYKLHQCVFNNVLTKQCNLTTTNLTGIKNEKDLHNRIYAAALLGTLQAGFTDFPYLSEKWKQVTEEEALIGCSFTGIADSSGLSNSQLQNAAKLVLEVNEKYARKIGINLASRTTAIKPEGTASCVLGSSSGIHARHSEYYLRRVRMNKDDELTKYLLRVIPELVEDDLFSKSGVVVTIPQESPVGAITRHQESAMSLFNRVKHYYENWIVPGHRSGVNTHNVSCTINYKPEEVDELRTRLWEDRNSYAAVSLLPFSDTIYKQAPFEDCDKETFTKFNKMVNEIDLTKVMEFEDNTNRAEQLACSAGGICEIV
jgi:ribonucleotide reductase class II